MIKFRGNYFPKAKFILLISKSDGQTILFFVGQTDLKTFWRIKRRLFVTSATETDIWLRVSKKAKLNLTLFCIQICFSKSLLSCSFVLTIGQFIAKRVSTETRNTSSSSFYVFIVIFSCDFFYIFDIFSVSISWVFQKKVTIPSIFSKINSIDPHHVLQWRWLIL